MSGAISSALRVVERAADPVSVARVRTLVREGLEVDSAAELSERSPLGPRAIRIRPLASPDLDAGCVQLERWLGSRNWAEAAISRPPHVYLRVATEALCDWIVDASSGGAPGSGVEGASCAITVSFPEGDADAASLDASRRLAVARSIAAMLRARTFEVELAPAADDEVVCRGLGASEAIPVAAVDVPQGALRARHGGTVDVQDLLSDDDDLGQAVLTFVLLRSDRTRRVVLSDAKLAAERASVAAVLDVRTPGQAEAIRPTTARVERGRRALALELDVLPLTAAKAAAALDPAPVVRLCASIGAASTAVSPNDPLRSAARVALDATCALAAIPLPHTALVEVPS